MYAIKKGSLYVAIPGSKKSYTNKIERARLFDSYEDAKRDACGNETVVNVSLFARP